MRILTFLLGLFMTQQVLSAEHQNAYGFSFQTLVGHKPLPLKDFEGKVILLVNTASNCGFTPQYKELEALYQTYKDKGLVVLGVPSNDFGRQEPGSTQEIAEFCQVNYGVSFPMTAKEVVSGKKAHPLYIWLREKLGFGSAPKWNFHKYLINRKGQPIAFYYSITSPTSKKIVTAVEKALNEH